MKNLKLIAISFILLCTCYSCEKEEPFSYEEDVQIESTSLISQKIIKNGEPGFILESRNTEMGGFANHEVVLFKGKIWSIGGDNSGTPPYTPGSDIWSSSDGINWDFVRNNAFPARQNHSVLVYKNKVWVIGGVDDLGNELNDIWNSNDGINWRRISRWTSIGSIANNSSVIFKDRIYIFIGSGEVTTKVWSSSDGSIWRLETSNAFPVRNYTRAIAFKDYLYVVGGLDRDSGSYSNDVWASHDGIFWRKNLPGPSPDPSQERIFSPRIEHTMTEYNGRVWIIGGKEEGNNFSNEIWSTSNMKYWKKHRNLPKSATLSSHASLLYGDELWILGGYHQQSDRSSVLSSSIWSMR
ncbi:hypothetical protein DZC72_09295 [Maribacter algicola]|uniref:DUF6242 domain-containing protein n=1 Tax=Maribacter algicola TaxID=2498892 RepID=A0A3R8RAQ2_9FLAO|nr:hypothetical protein [Maribacter algicola]RRQ50703.1 hypothetical protein DZC72_09295 [Maribacter algicola]